MPPAAAAMTAVAIQPSALSHDLTQTRPSPLPRGHRRDRDEHHDHPADHGAEDERLVWRASDAGSPPDRTGRVRFFQGRDFLRRQLQRQARDHVIEML